MALSLARRFAGLLVKSFTKKEHYSLSFTASAASTAMLWQDGHRVTLARTADGVYTLTLDDKFKRITGQATVLKSGDWDAKVQTLVEGGAATNVVTIEVNNIGVALDDPEAAVLVDLKLISGGGAA